MPYRIVALIAAAFALVATADLAAADGGRGGSGGATMTESGEVYVKRGYRGPGVKLIQRKLGLTGDGVFGPLTERAVKRFQRRHGLVADGVVGPVTRRALGIGSFSRGSVYRRSGTGSGLPRVLRRIAECESGGDPTAVSADGRYRGKYQFTRSTWRRLGGEGDPAQAPEWLQDRLALRLYRQSGTDPWPACSR